MVFPKPGDDPSRMPLLSEVEVAPPNNRCIGSTQHHPGLPRQQMLQDGISDLSLAQTHLHTAQPDDIVNLVDNINNMLPDGTHLVCYVMTVLTGRDHHVHQALLQHHLELVPTITGNRATRLISAARRTGLRPTEIWELARTLSIDPRHHSIQRPTLDQDILQDVAQAAIRTGIPESMVAILRAETTPDVTGEHTPQLLPAPLAPGNAQPGQKGPGLLQQDPPRTRGPRPENPRRRPPMPTSHTPGDEPVLHPRP